MNHPTLVVKEFQGRYRFLSNFWMTPVDIDGTVFPSAEHAYQALKTDSVYHRGQVRAALTPGQAKRMGKTIPLRAGWDDRMKLETMLRVVRAKFSQNDDCRRLLLDTAGQELIEGNRWGDVFWGVCNGRGENHLGRILMQVRDEMIVEIQDEIRRSETEP